MPLPRYQIRNQFYLADPDLYRAAYKDDPEALLEAVAMAGFVGLLRQLGDLAEFAAEIFHDLNEDIMAMSARGQGLTARIQQLEADVPLIEKNILSLTNHTKFYYNTGVDWNSQVCTNQNIITQGDMPRFIRDSYEECRGPPQLFLLDKFDIGGAGACLKRYTNPSSFRADPTISDTPRFGIQRDKRTRKIKKKGSHWRNADAPKILTTSHAKLHQLLLEERVGNDSKDTTHHVNLKKRIIAFSQSSNSYMEKVLQIMTPEHSDETEVGQPLLRLTFNDTDALEREIHDIQPVRAAEDTHYYSQNGQEMKLRPSAMYTYDFNKSRRNRGSTVSVEDGNSVGTASSLRIPVTEKESGVDGDRRDINGSVSPYYDATANETDFYMDALANMESEAETDNEYIPKKEQHYFSEHTGDNGLKEQVLDPLSVDNSIVPDDGSISFIKWTSTSSSHGAPYEKHVDIEVDSCLSTKTCEAVEVDSSDSFDYDMTDKILNANVDTVGSVATPDNYTDGNISFQKGSSHLFQSPYSELMTRELTSGGAYYNMEPSEAVYDSEYPQLERTRVNGGAVATPDGPFKVDNVSVKRASIERHESKLPSEGRRLSSKDFRHDHSKLSSMIDKGTLQKGHVDEFLTENLANKDVSFQSGTDTQLHNCEQGYEDGDGHPRVPDNENIESNHVVLSNNENAKHGTGEILEGYYQLMNIAAENVENTVAALLEVHTYDDGGLYTVKRELDATESLSERCDTEGHESSDELSFERVPKYFVAPESDISGKCDCEQAALLASINSLSGNRSSDKAVIYPSDCITQQFGDLTEKDVNFVGTPPLPPLPPMQWMVGKHQDSFFDAEEESAEYSVEVNRSLLPSVFGVRGSFHLTPPDAEIKQPLKAADTDESSQNTSSHHPGSFPLSTASSLQVTDDIEEHGERRCITSDTLNANSSMSMIHHRTDLKSGQPDSLALARETLEINSRSCLPSSPSYSDAFMVEAVQSSPTAQSSVALLETMTTLTNKIVQPRAAEHTLLSAGEPIRSSEPLLGDTDDRGYKASEVPVLSADQSLEELTSCCRTTHETQSVEDMIVKPPQVPGPLKEEEDNPKQEIKSSEQQAPWSLALLNYEGEKLAEKPPVKLPRPRNPLIESVDALDRSKLKKVTTLNRPKQPTIDENGSLLEQIRTKSLDLKPAAAPVSKPIIQAPRVNLKVAAILEKANKIRWATAGSDEDDWSDD